MLNFFPTSITAGLNLKCEVISHEFLAPEWELHAILRGPSAIDLVSIAIGTAHQFAVSASDTQGWNAGDYAASIRAVSGGDVHEVEAGQVKITPDLVGLEPGHDARGHAQKVLDAIEAVIEGRASKDQQSYTINGRALVRTAIADLLLLRDRYKKEFARQKAGGPGKLLRRKVKVGFSR
ncbi:hypothetical protein TRP8649_01387 [Pelagimonas phthalicica]|uniref:Uncharacterized protein n=1 Tax=Pelagimonas phthalicica TaxID=1037362 RepID=A0A238JAQ0_9RHOB|nr:hypothetical protein [Pelagimonas phthalicica]TDS94191.1 hypothetical protein CLV87_0685 [Pelagimonas phthalicica]SMX27284.1 hypothetical protein TRP8649_01387 [Pelagimonas phthalicica]